MCYLRYSEDCTDQRSSRGRGCTLVPYNSCFADIFYVHWRVKRKMEVLCIWTCESAYKLHMPRPDLTGHTLTFSFWACSCSSPSSALPCLLQLPLTPLHPIFIPEQCRPSHTLCICNWKHFPCALWRTARTVWKTAWRCALSFKLELTREM